MKKLVTLLFAGCMPLAAGAHAQDAMKKDEMKK